MVKNIDGLNERLKKLESVSGGSTIPPGERLYIINDTDEKVIEKKKADREAYLEEKYGKRKKGDPPIIFVICSEPKTLPGERCQASDVDI